jgi:hypothetical protein
MLELLTVLLIKAQVSVWVLEYTNPAGLNVTETYSDYNSCNSAAKAKTNVTRWCIQT